MDELSTKLDRAKASLQKSKAEYNQLLSNAVLDDTSVARTQQALLRAYEADQKAYEELEKLRASEIRTRKQSALLSKLPMMHIGQHSRLSMIVTVL